MALNRSPANMDTEDVESTSLRFSVGVGIIQSLSLIKSSSLQSRL